MKRFLASTLTLVAGLGAVEICASAATYNFIFNNTEQGDNSTATPSLSLAPDGTVTKTGADGKPVSSTQGVAQTPGGTTQVSSTSAPADSGAATGSFRHLRLIGSAAIYQSSYGDSSGPKWGGSFAYLFNRELGLNAFAALLPTDDGSGSNNVLAGLELEVTPIRLSFGRFDNLLEAGILLGGTHIPDHYGVWAEPHIGGRVNLNLGESWGLTAAGRYASDYKMAEAGLAIRL